MPQEMTRRISIPVDELIIQNLNGREVWEIPHSANSRYLSHGYFRYIGKFPPQLARAFIQSYGDPNELLIDPMCGGGTSLIEAKMANIRAFGSDVNPIALLVSRVATTVIPADKLDRTIEDLASTLTVYVGGQGTLGGRRLSLKSPKPPNLFGNDIYFDALTLHQLTLIKALIDQGPWEIGVRDFLTVAFVSILRQVSRANVKKMNTEIDETKRAKPAIPTFLAKVRRMADINRGLPFSTTPEIVVQEHDARALPHADNSAGLVILHPPYMTNTAFSESVQLPLAWLGWKHKDIWHRELRCRGSFLHEPDGLRKYLVGWHQVLREAHRLLKPGARCCIVIGDGQIDYVRIPMSSITKEFATDIGFVVERELIHRLNNNTGMTLSHKMRGQNVLIVAKR